MPETTAERRAPISSNPETTQTAYTPSKSSGAVPRSSASRNGFPPPGVTVQDDDEEEFCGSAPREDEEAVEIVSKASIRVAPETPRKAAKACKSSTPGKRRYSELADNATGTAPRLASSPATMVPDDDPFTNGHSAPTTPARCIRNPHSDPDSDLDLDLDLAPEILHCLRSHDVSPMTPGLKKGIDVIGERHGRHTLGLIRARDRWLEMVRRKDETIRKLRDDVDALRVEFRHLQLDLEIEREKVGK